MTPVERAYMQKFGRLRKIVSGLISLSVLVGGFWTLTEKSSVAHEQGRAKTQSGLTGSQVIPTGKVITPTAAKGAIFQDLDPGLASAPLIRAGHAAAVCVSPNGRMLAILTSGWNLHFDKNDDKNKDLSNEYVFVFDISELRPRQIQVLQIPNTFQGLAWGSSSDHLYAAGGMDDVVYEFVRAGKQFERGRLFQLHHPPAMQLGKQTNPPLAGALAVSPDGSLLLVGNFQHDSVSLIELKSGTIITEQDLRPGKIDPSQRGKQGGSYPRSVVWASDNRAYVASERDREIISLAVRNNEIRVLRRMPVQGQPVALLSNRDGSRLYAAMDNEDNVAVFDTRNDKLLEQFNVVAPASAYVNGAKLGGANSNALALTPDGGTLLVSNGGQNSIAVIRLSQRAMANSESREKGRPAYGKNKKDKDDDGDDDDAAASRPSEVVGLVPTGWYPAGIAVSKNGGRWFVVNGKSPTGPNAAACRPENTVDGKCRMIDFNPADFSVKEQTYDNDQAVIQLEKAGFLTIPAPSAIELARLTKQVASNNGFDRPDKTAADAKLFAFLQQHIKHVIYVIKENRSYDQILGDLDIGNGDPRLAVFGAAITPNHHAMARNFVTLDNFMVSGEGSWTGWQWSTAARTSDFAERNDFIGLAGRGGDAAGRGLSRALNMVHATSAERHAEFSLAPTDPDILPGTNDVAELDGPGGDLGRGYVWDTVLRAGQTVRNYGFYGYLTATPPDPLIREPFTQKQQVFYPSNIALKPFTDVYFRGWDDAMPDFWRYREWRREFDQFVERKELPNLILVRLGNDHTGAFERAIDGINSPETQVADNDYALGLLTEAVANSPFADSTLVISVEDDTWNGFDHVDAFRSPVLIDGPYVRQGALVSTRYTTVNLVKTIEQVLGVEPIGLNDALAAPMSDIFDPNVTTWTYKAAVPDILRSTQIPLPQSDHANVAFPRHPARYWVKAMKDQDFSGPDQGDPVSYNRELWRGLKGNAPFPANRPGNDLRNDRERLLRESCADSKNKCEPPHGQ
jgi:DNA-binding beta-propeller fold protein YncE